MENCYWVFHFPQLGACKAIVKITSYHFNDGYRGKDCSVDDEKRKAKSVKEGEEKLVDDVNSNHPTPLESKTTQSSSQIPTKYH